MDGLRGFKRRLCLRASAAVLLTSVAGVASAQPIDLSSFWIELDGGYNFDAGQVLQTFPSGTLAGGQRARPHFDWDVDGKLGYQPASSPWVVDLGVKFGRTVRANKSFSGTTPTAFGSYTQKVQSATDVTHTVVDFEVGRDVGVGAMSKATVGLGVRYARFESDTTGTFTSASKYKNNSNFFDVNRHNHMIGPRVWLRGTTPIGASNFSVGWGGGAAVLFARESVSSRYDVFPVGSNVGVYYYYSSGQDVTVPNVDGYLKVSYHAPGTPATIGIGYRVDSYWNAMDGGLGTVRKVNVIEHGPFLSMVWRLP